MALLKEDRDFPANGAIIPWSIITLLVLSARNIGRSQIDYMIKNDEKLMKEKERQYDYFFNEDSLTVNCIVQGCYQIT